MFESYGTLVYIVDAPLMKYRPYADTVAASGKTLYFTEKPSAQWIVSTQYERRPAILCVVRAVPISEHPRRGVVCTTAADALEHINHADWTPCEFWFTDSRATADAAVDPT